jgi:hypothetical protein
MTEAPREDDEKPRHGDPLAQQVSAVEPAAQPFVSESNRSAYAVPGLDRPGVNDASAGTDDAIARRAYELYQARGGTHGADVDDWLQAEQELRVGRGPSDGPSDEPDNPAHRPID